MKVKDLYIKNFGIIKEESFSFPDGIILIGGNNGEGKSTVFKALSLLFYNTLVNGGKLGDQINWDSEEAFVSANFEHKGIEYYTDITIKPKGSSRNLKSSDYLKLDSTSSVIEKLNDIFDFKRALASTCSFEHEIDLIRTTPAERREYLKNIYNLNFKSELSKIDIELKNNKENLISLNSKKQVLSTIEFIPEIKDRLPFSEEIYTTKKQQVEGLNNALSKINNDISDLEFSLSEVSSKKAKIINLKTDIIALESEITKLDTELNDINNKINEFGLDEKLEKFKEALENDLIILSEKKETTSNEIIKLEEEKKNSSILIIKREELSTTLRELENTLGREEFSLIALTEKYESIKSGICPTCSSKIDSSQTEEISNTISQKTKEINLIKEKIKSVKEKIDNLPAYRLTEVIDSEIKSNREDIAEIKVDITEIESNKESALLTKKNNLEEGLSNLEFRKESISSSISHYKEKVTAINREVAENTVNDEEIKSELNKKQVEKEEKLKFKISLNEEINSYDSTVIENSLKDKNNEKLSKSKLENENKLVEIEEELESTSNSIRVIEKSKAILSKEFPSYVLSKLVSNLELITNEFLKEVYPKYHLTFKENTSSLDVLYSNGIDAKMASGYEKQIFSFAYKYALGVIQDYNILFLDEVDSASSEENSALFYSMLSKLSKDYFKQIFLITHKDSVKDLMQYDFNARVYIADKGNIREAINM